MKPTLTQVENAIEEWKRTHSDLPVHEYLGWSEAEYASWIKNYRIPDRDLPKRRLTKANAIKRANKLGYTIRYHEDGDHMRFRKPGGAVTALNIPYEYCVVEKIGKSWFVREMVEPDII